MNGVNIFYGAVACLVFIQFSVVVYYIWRHYFPKREKQKKERPKVETPGQPKPTAYEKLHRS
jgi:membrane protein implicated in regulation of membrane protease activity